MLQSTKFLLLLSVFVTTTQSLQVVYDSGLKRCACTFYLNIDVKQASRLKITAVTSSEYKAWKSGTSKSLLTSTPPMYKAGMYKVAHRITGTGSWALIVHASDSVIVKADVKSQSNACELNLSFTSRILKGVRPQGKDAEQADYSALIAEPQLCSGALITPNWIISAAFCNFKKGGKVFLGENHVRRTITKVVRHPQYRVARNGVYFNIALAKIDEPMYATELKLYSGSSSKLDGRFVRESGFGRSVANKGSDGKLRIADVPVLSVATCREHFRRTAKFRTADALDSFHHYCTDATQCGVKSCNGDAGAPLVAVGGSGEHVLVGVLSYSAGSCSAVPDVVSNIASYSKWIASETGNKVKFTSKLQGDIV